MIKLQDYIYQLEDSDLLSDNNGSYILIEDYLNISILLNNIPGTTDSINFYGLNNNENIIIDYLNIQGLNDNIQINNDSNQSLQSNSNNLQTYPINTNTNLSTKYQIFYNLNSYFIQHQSNQNYGYKKIYIPLLPPDININNYKLIVNNLNHKINNVNFYQKLYELFNQNINLYTSQIENKEQNFQQNMDVLNPQEINIEEIKIAKHVIYNKNDNVSTPPIVYLPISNIQQQNILVQYNDAKLQSSPPLAFHLQILNENNQIIFQLKKELTILYDYEYGMYGYKYGVIIKENDDITKQEILATIYSNEQIYSNIYIIVWQLNQKQIDTIKLNNNRNNSNVKFRIRYSNSKDDNNNFIWKGWSQEIQNIIINTIPQKPSQIKMNTI